MTIYEIAEAAGVSISTVSRVMNTPEKVSPSTRSRVEEVLKKYNYVPSSLARGLVKSETKTVGILLPNIQKSFFHTTAQVLEKAFFEQGYMSLLCCIEENIECEMEYIRMLAEKKVDGLVLVSSIFSTPKVFKSLQNYMPNTPAVIINGTSSGPNIYTVFTDHRPGIQKIFDHLEERGYQRVYLYYTSKSQNTAKKIEVFQEIIEQRHSDLKAAEYIVHGDETLDAIRNFAKALQPKLTVRTAVLFANDELAAMGCRAFQEKGLAIPGDIGIVAYDNVFPALHQISNPPITSLDTKVPVLALQASYTLHNIFTQQPCSKGISVIPELVVRSST